MDNKNDQTQYYCSIENYISDEYSICREERQYALFLYNILQKYSVPSDRTEKIAKIFEACNIPPMAEIKHVFYEAALMRDFFERNRRLVLGNDSDKDLLVVKFSPKNPFDLNKEKDSFNAKLIQYVKKPNKSICMTEKCTDEKCEVKWKNLGHNKIACEKLTEKEKLQIKYMMNAKPDIAVIYRQDEQDHLLFLECKFESGEDTYYGGFTQREIQWMIADFLRKNYLTDLKVSPKMENKKSCLVQFVRKEPQNSCEIPINMLIDLNKEIFN